MKNLEIKKGALGLFLENSMRCNISVRTMSLQSLTILEYAQIIRNV